MSREVGLVTCYWLEAELRIQLEISDFSIGRQTSKARNNECYILSRCGEFIVVGSIHVERSYIDVRARRDVDLLVGDSVQDLCLCECVDVDCRGVIIRPRCARTCNVYCTYSATTSLQRR